MDIPERTCKTNKIAGKGKGGKQWMTLTHLSLFTGIGGIDLAAEWAGFKTIGQVERNEYANKILRLRFGDVPRWKDISDVSADDFRRKTGIEHPTLITGGFPCQPFSVAGKRRGKEDDRYLWPEMFRVVRELRPAWVLGENVAGIIGLALDICCADLESAGYTVRAFLIPACAVGAPHRRDRVFIVANSTSTRLERADTQGGTCTGRCTSKLGQGGWETNWWQTEPRLGRVADGVPHRVDRLRCLGNAVVPQQAYPILKAIAEIEGGVNEV